MLKLIVNAERISINEYRLITENDHSYYYKCIDTKNFIFMNEENKWRDSIMEGQQILLDWIQNKNESPAYISWNYEGRAMLNVKLSKFYNNEFLIEINPFENKNNDTWVIDKNCPLE
jgi:hypothetical protein